MARAERRQRSLWPLAAWPLATALLIAAALAAGTYLDDRPLILIPAPAPGASPTPETHR